VLLKPAFSLAQGVPLVAPRPGSSSVTVSGTVGKYYLSISGYIAPFASIVLYADGAFLRSTVADEKGYFLIPEILVKEGLAKICFDAVDFRRLGESYSCLAIKPITGPTTIDNVFLPPTLGLSRSEIAAGSSSIAWGYSMPYARVTLHFGNLIYTTTADSTGYYQIELKNVKAGVYSLYSTAELNNKPSLDPEKKVTLKALSWWEQLIAWLLELLKKLWLLLTSLSFGPLWIAIPIIILIIILILRLWPERFTYLYNNKVIIFFTKALRRHKPLHHEYFMGY
jgi:hypothetical protein